MLISRNKRRADNGTAAISRPLSLLALLLLCPNSSNGFIVSPPSSRGGTTAAVSQLTSRFATNNSQDDDAEQQKQQQDEMIAKKLLAKERTMAALSNKRKDGSEQQAKQNNNNQNKQQQQQKNSKRTNMKSSNSKSALQQTPPKKQDDPMILDRFANARTTTTTTKRDDDDDMDRFENTRNKAKRESSDNRNNNNNNNNSKPRSKASLLPPPLANFSDDDLTSGLSSWEEFLGQSNNAAAAAAPPPPPPTKATTSSSAAAQLPTISDLFSASEQPSPKDPPPNGGSGSIQGMDGVLPVSELFYRSSQSLSQEAYTNTGGSADDEELPFSAEQSDALVSEDGLVQIRRNQAQKERQQQQARRSRKMVRRGMEMLVGGVPINVDPPQRSVELSYQVSSDGTNQIDWAQAISLSSRDFGPLLQQGSAKDVTDIERGLFCESFVHSAIKWDVCPEDLKDIVKKHSAAQKSSYSDLLEDTNDVWKQQQSRANNTTTSAFATTTTDDTNNEDDDKAAQEFLEHPDMPFEYTFLIQGVSKEELESITDPVTLERTLLRAIVLVAKDKLLVDDFTVEANRLSLTSTEEEGTTQISLVFHFEAEGEEEDIMPIAQSIKPTLTQALNDGAFGEALSEAAAEQGWYEEIIDEISDEWVFLSPEGNSADKDSRPSIILDPNSPDPVPKTGGLLGEDTASDLYLGGGNDHVFFDYSEANRENAPYQGSLGPLLLDAAVERAKQRYPRVIAIGDVHGCIDELQDLLRKCDYQPGDLVVFLGDLVCKGPDSISVVQMAREIGAIGIRGNHDFEVVRWYQAIQSGVDPPVVGSEHFHIASCLSKDDMKWLYSLPWYISSKDLGALFVHAGFVAGIRLAKQNPRLMMNMRSILPDGTVTSKFFSNWPWARLWDGPQTVLFGHDADRGLQQYEHAIGLDTGCVYGGRLTACILPEKRLVSVTAKREYFKYRRRHYD
jgi:hypothetical protein